MNYGLSRGARLLRSLPITEAKANTLTNEFSGPTNLSKKRNFLILLNWTAIDCTPNWSLYLPNEGKTVSERSLSPITCTAYLWSISNSLKVNNFFPSPPFCNTGLPDFLPVNCGCLSLHFCREKNVSNRRPFSSPTPWKRSGNQSELTRDCTQPVTLIYWYLMFQDALKQSAYASTKLYYKFAFERLFCKCFAFMMD